MLAAVLAGMLINVHPGQRVDGPEVAVEETVSPEY